VTGANGTKGVILPNTPGVFVVWNNTVAQNLQIYPPSGAQINTNGTNAAYTAPGEEIDEFYYISATQWAQNPFATG
jgi:hypothetical protein